MYTALKLETTALSFRSKQRTLVQEMHDKFVEVGLTVSCTFFVHVIFEKYRMECADLSSIDAPTDLVMAEIPDIDAIERRKWNYMAGTELFPGMVRTTMVNHFFSRMACSHNSA